MKNRFSISQRFRQFKETNLNQAAFKGGAYSIIITAVVLAILIVVNMFAQALPSTATQYDISSGKLYSITSNTKVVVNALEKDVTIYWIVQSGQEDDILEKLLDKYETLSDHLKVVKKNPDIYPTFTQKYTSETVSNNSLIVECGTRSRVIDYEDIYLSSGSTLTDSGSTSFDGEGAITSAIDYVVNAQQPQLYLLEGHGEAELSSSFSDQIEGDNMETNTFSLLNENAVPEEADCVLIYAPTSDISKKEKKILANYVASGGKLFVMAGLAEKDDLHNLYSLLSDYGVESEDGIVVDVDSTHYAFQQPYILMPDMKEDEITNPLIEENYYAIVPIARGLTVKETDSDAVVTELLTTSQDSYSKTDGYDISTYEKEAGDVDGPFALAVSIETAGEGGMVWVASSEFADDTYNSYSSGANIDLTMNAISSLVGESEAVSIRSKSLQYDYLTISDQTASLLKNLLIGLFPLAYLLVGIIVVVRRKRQNDAN